MHSLVAWSGFVGAWLLVAGPLFQAALELQEESFSREDMETTVQTVGEQPRVSPWWWLLPPVYYVLHRRSERAYRDAVFAAMSQEQRSQFVSFSNTARGWLYVGLGAFFIALKETWELVEEHEWPTWVFWVAVAVMLVVCVANTVLSSLRSVHVIEGSARPARRRPRA